MAPVPRQRGRRYRLRLTAPAPGREGRRNFMCLRDNPLCSSCVLSYVRGERPMELHDRSGPMLGPDQGHRESAACRAIGEEIRRALRGPARRGRAQGTAASSERGIIDVLQEQGARRRGDADPGRRRRHGGRAHRGNRVGGHAVVRPALHQPVQLPVRQAQLRRTTRWTCCGRARRSASRSSCSGPRTSTRPWTGPWRSRARWPTSTRPTGGRGDGAALRLHPGRAPGGNFPTCPFSVTSAAPGRGTFELPGVRERVRAVRRGLRPVHGPGQDRVQRRGRDAAAMRRVRQDRVDPGHPRPAVHLTPGRTGTSR